MNPKHATADSFSTNAFAADLTAAVYQVALRHGAGLRWLELELALWNAVTDTIDKWLQELSGCTVPRLVESTHPPHRTAGGRGSHRADVALGSA
jgi:hypothetical protein